MACAHAIRVDERGYGARSDALADELVRELLALRASVKSDDDVGLGARIGTRPPVWQEQHCEQHPGHANGRVKLKIAPPSLEPAKRRGGATSSPCSRSA